MAGGMTNEFWKMGSTKCFAAMRNPTHKEVLGFDRRLCHSGRALPDLMLLNIVKPDSEY